MQISLVSGLVLISEKGFSVRGNFPPENRHFPPFGKKAPHFRDALHNLHLFSLKMLIAATTVVTLPVFAASIPISSALVVSLGAVLATLIGQGSVDK
jgi:hypothetical protein